MSPTQMMPVATTYTPMSDALDRHDYGVSKHRKSASTGGGRAWSEDEEAYLLQTRLQKMPYKHIAAHLKKTELACRLHYHQLSHGSNRRKRTASLSSTSSDHSPLLAALAPSPDHDNKGRSLSPPTSCSSYDTGRGVQLPSIMESGRLPAILPKPASLGMVHLNGPAQGYLPPVTERPAHLPSLSLQRESHGAAPPLRLDCSGAPRVPSHNRAHVDMARLHAVYASYRNTFWAAIANEYGGSVGPAVLEQAWKTGMCCSGQRSGSPITPVDSPEEAEDYMRAGAQDKTRIATILGEAAPRNVRDSDMVRRIEGERFGSVMST